MINTFDLSEKIVLITGGYGHLGEAVVNHLAYYNAKVYVLGRNESKYKEVFKENINSIIKICEIPSFSKEDLQKKAKLH